MTARRSTPALPKTMQALSIPEKDKLQFVALPVPKPKPTQVLIKTACIGINRADLLQLKGLYPLPAGANPIPGLEISGVIVALGNKVKGWKKGDRVAALLDGGGYAEYCVAESSLLLPVPKTMTMENAAALPEALYTVAMALFVKGKLKRGESVLIHSGASGIATMAIQMARAAGATVYTTAGTDKKCTLSRSLGAHRAFNYKTGDFAAQLKSIGADVILDTTGGDNIAKNISVLNEGGRMVVIGFLRGAKGEINAASLLFKELSILGAALRRQPLAAKKSIKKQVDIFYPKVQSGRITPVIDSVHAFKNAEKALQRMEQNLNIGKIVLKV